VPRDFHTQAAQLLERQAQPGIRLSVLEERVGVLSEIRQCDNPCFFLPEIIKAGNFYRARFIEQYGNRALPYIAFTLWRAWACASQ